MTVGIAELKEHVAGVVITPEDAGYADAIHRWAANAERKAAVVVQVTSPADVAAAVLPPHPPLFFNFGACFDGSLPLRRKPV